MVGRYDDKVRYDERVKYVTYLNTLRKYTLKRQIDKFKQIKITTNK
jgi:hypothetical protein